jgi:hypothetical protein
VQRARRARRSRLAVQRSRAAGSGTMAVRSWVRSVPVIRFPVACASNLASRDHDRAQTHKPPTLPKRRRWWRDAKIAGPAQHGNAPRGALGRSRTKVEAHMAIAAPEKLCVWWPIKFYGRAPSLAPSGGKAASDLATKKADVTLYPADRGPESWTFRSAASSVAQSARWCGGGRDPSLFRQQRNAGRPAT